MRKKQNIILACVWAALLVLCFVNRDRFTVDGVLAYTPANPFLAAAFMLVLFAVKSLSIFIFSGILFAANGILFPLPAAIALNILGAAVMVSLPYWIGRRTGKDAVDQIVQKYPKAGALRNFRSGHEFALSYITRIIGALPSDVLSLYMGASGTGYPAYLAGSILGMLPSIVAFPIMGMNVTDPTSPAFLVSFGCKTAISGASMLGYWLYRRKKATFH